MAKQTFIIVPTSKREALEPMLSVHAVDHLQIDEGVFVATFDGTAREFAEVLGIRSGETSSGIVCAISSYSGRQPTEVWEWLKVNWPIDS